VIPVFLAVTAMSLLNIGMVLSVAIPLLTMVTTVMFLPLGLGNPEIARLVRRISPDVGTTSDDFIVQLTLTPRIRTGLRALLEDADDIGVLRLTKSELVFQGDSIQLTLPFEQVRTVRRQNIGLRGLFLYGPRIEMVAWGIPNAESIEFAERASWLLPTSRQITRRLFDRLVEECKHQGVGAAPGGR